MNILSRILDKPLAFRRVAFVGAGAMLAFILYIIHKHATDLNEHAGAVLLAIVAICSGVALFYFKQRGDR